MASAELICKLLQKLRFASLLGAFLWTKKHSESLWLPLQFFKTLKNSIFDWILVENLKYFIFQIVSDWLVCLHSVKQTSYEHTEVIYKLLKVW